MGYLLSVNFLKCFWLNFNDLITCQARYCFWSHLFYLLLVQS